MPKKKPLKEVQDARQAHKEKVKKYPVSTVYLQVIGSGAPGAPRSLYVFTEHCRYLFNCGEGTQRLANEHKVKLSMMEHIFVTHKSWDNVGGLPGILLTLQDAGVPQIMLHGPPGIEILYEDTKNFMRFQDLKIEYCPFEQYSKEAEIGPLVIKAVPICADKVGPEIDVACDVLEKNTAEPIGDLFGFEKSNPLARATVAEVDISQQKGYCSDENPKDISMAYVCHPVPKPGALRSKLCLDLGVPSGPLMGLLKQGKDVTLTNGKIVKAAEVTEPPDQGPIFIVLEVPTTDHLDSLISSTSFEKHMNIPGNSEKNHAQLIVHFSPSKIIQDERYRHWMSLFPPSTHHIYINEDSRCMGSERVHKIQHKLNHIYNNSFPLLADNGINNKSTSPSMKKRRVLSESCKGTNPNEIEEPSQGEHLNGRIPFDILDTQNLPASHMNISDLCDNIIKNAHQAFTLLSYHIRPHKKLDKSGRLYLDCSTYVNECYDNEGFSNIMADVRQGIADAQMQNSNAYSDAHFPNLVFLGTGSCIPNKTRNTSGILLNLSNTSSLIMDCGEGTYGQLVRLFGVQGSSDVLKKVKGIFISHLHADHHIGLIRLLLARIKAYPLLQKTPELIVLAPLGIIYYLKSYHINFEPILHRVKLVSNSKLNSITKNPNLDLEDVSRQRADVSTHLGVMNFETCYVRHCPHAFGVSITTLEGFKIVYSGDTLPSDNLISIGQSCDLLIHEATMEDDLKEDAILKRHSTTSDALWVGQRMDSKSIILTHFSQRYAKVPLLKEEDAAKVVIAFDNMIVHLRDLPLLPLLYPAFVSIFSEDYDEMMEKSMKRKAKELLKLSESSQEVKTTQS